MRQSELRFIRFLFGLGAILGVGLFLRGAVLILSPVVRGTEARVESPAQAAAPRTRVRSKAVRASTAEAASGPTVQVDRVDYAPGQRVTITGTGWPAGEVVRLALVEDPPLDTHPDLYATATQTGEIFNNE